jgi:outer membrane receptor protein involved in Fe transport
VAEEISMKFMRLGPAILCLAMPGMAGTRAWAADSVPVVDTPAGDPAAAPAEGAPKVEEEVVVSATRGPRSVADVPVSVTVIPREELKATPAHTLDDVLRDVPGISLPGSNSSLVIPTLNAFSMRGVGGNRALVMLDGAPVNDPWSGDVNWSRIPRSTIDRVEVARGGGASLFGNYAMSGTVGVLSVPADTRNLWADASYGSYATSRVDALVTEPLTDSIGVGVNADTFDTDGFQRYRLTRGPIDIPFWSRNRLFGARVDGTAGGDAAFFVRGNHFDTSISQGSPLAHDEKRGFEGGTGVQLKDTLGGDLSAQVFALHQQFDTDNSGLFPGQGRDREFLSNSHVATSQRIGGSLQWSRHLGTTVPFVTAGIDLTDILGEDRVDTFNSGGSHTDTDRAGGRQDFTGLFAEADFFPHPRFEVLLSARLDLWSNSDGHDYSLTAPGVRYPTRRLSQFDPRISLREDLGGGWAARAAAYRAFGAPTLDVLYEKTSTKTSITFPNPNLKPETLLGAEAGLEFAGGPLSAQMNVFQNSVTDGITNVSIATTPIRTRIRANVGKTRSRGIELFGNASIGSGWKVLAGYTFTDARVVDNPTDRTLEGHRVEKIPQSVVTGGLSYTAPRGWEVSLRGRYFSKAYQDVTALMRLDPGAVFDASVSVPLGQAFDLTLTGENVLDRRYTAEASQGPRIAEPAVFFVGIRVHPFSSRAGKGTRRAS